MIILFPILVEQQENPETDESTLQGEFFTFTYTYFNRFHEELFR